MNSSRTTTCGSVLAQRAAPALVLVSTWLAGCDCTTTAEDATSTSPATLVYTESGAAAGAANRCEAAGSSCDEGDSGVPAHDGSPSDRCAAADATNVGTASTPRCTRNINSATTAAFPGDETGGMAPSGPIAVYLIDGAVTLTIDFPDGQGTYQLRDLHAQICDTACTSAVGTLAVTEAVGSCGTRACGRFDAALTIMTDDTDPAALSLSGSARLMDVEVPARQCTSSLTGGPNLVDD